MCVRGVFCLFVCCFRCLVAVVVVWVVFFLVCFVLFSGAGGAGGGGVLLLLFCWLVGWLVCSKHKEAWPQSACLKSEITAAIDIRI